MKCPVPPYPSIGEVVYECAIRSGLVSSSDGSELYDRLKAFRDDRKRPGLRPIEFPTETLVAFERKVTDFLGDEHCSLMIAVGLRRWLDQYSGLIATHDATLLERPQMLGLLWPTMFAAGANFFLSFLHELYPRVDPRVLLRSEAPLGAYIRALCVQGTQDQKRICEYRAEIGGIDFDNCRDTLDTWLKGIAVPNLSRCREILKSLQVEDELTAKVWLLVARIIAKTPAEYREAILVRWERGAKNIPPEEEFFWLKREVSWKVGERLNIGPDRPYGALITALYNASVPRDPEAVLDMLERLTRTWEPIAGQTFHIIAWLRGRFLVLNNQHDAAMEHYLDAYNLGAGRDPDIYRKVLDWLSLESLGKKGW
jgi:hypothetical protein